MLKKTMLIGVMCVSLLGISQTQCNGITKSNTQCKNITKKENSLCYNHDPNHVSKSKNQGKTVICSGITKQNLPCKRKTKDLSGKCYSHKND